VIRVSTLPIPQAVPKREYAGALAASPFCGQLQPAVARSIPLHTESDYRRMASYEQRMDMPVLLDYAHYYALLGRIVEAVFQFHPELRVVLLRFPSAYVVRIPKPLLDERVFFVSDVGAQLARELARGMTPCVAIEDDFRRDLSEPGMNRLRVRAYGDAFCASAWATLIERLEQLGLTQEQA
jgi:hypothetical protein